MMPPICEKFQANRNWISFVSKHKSNAVWDELASRSRLRDLARSD
jgi:hypothetical protein